jgi:hypothetical protein
VGVHSFTMAPPPRLSRPQSRLAGILSPLHLAIVAAILAPAPTPLHSRLRPGSLAPATFDGSPQSAPFHRRNASIPFHFARRASACGASQRLTVQLEDQPQGAGLLNEPPAVLLLPNHRQSHTLWWLGLWDSQVRRARVAQARSRPPGSSCRPSTVPRCRPSTVHLARGHRPYTSTYHSTNACIELQFSLFSSEE